MSTSHLTQSTTASPQRLYKYCSLRPEPTRGYTARILTHDEVYFANREELNDPFDCSFFTTFHGTDADRLEYCRLVARSQNPHFSEDAVSQLAFSLVSRFTGQHLENHQDVDMQKIVDGATADVGIFSLSEVNDDILMWSHYGDSHRGICIEFANVSPGDAHCVGYEDEYPSVNMFELLPDQSLTGVAVRLVTTKSKRWSYEREWRILSCGAGKTGVQLLRHSECITGIILGCNISQSDRTDVICWARDRSSEVGVFQATKQARRFGLDIAAID